MTIDVNFAVCDVNWLLTMVYTDASTKYRNIYLLLCMHVSSTYIMEVDLAILYKVKIIEAYKHTNAKKLIWAV